MLEEYTVDEWLREGSISFEPDYVWHPNKTAMPAVAVFVGDDSNPLVIFVDEVEDFISSFSSSLRRFAEDAKHLASIAVYEDEFDVQDF
jgi:hypothetical protein